MILNQAVTVNTPKIGRILLHCGQRDPRHLPLPAAEYSRWKEDPLQVLDREGVGTVVEMGVQRGRATKQDLKVGICGEHGGDPSSIGFC